MKIVDVIWDSSNLSYKDFSGFNTAVTKIGAGSWKITPPLTSKTYNAIRITPTSKLSIANVPIGKYSHESESFSINMYFKAITKDQPINILYSSDSNFGLTYDGNINFKIKDALDQVYILQYLVPDKKESYHISATYDNRTISLIINGNLESSLTLPSSFKFKSTSNQTFISENGTFLLDRVQILNEIIPLSKHQLELRQDKYIQDTKQTMQKDGSHYWDLDYGYKQISDSFEYGVNKFFDTAVLTNLEVDQEGNLIVTDGQLTGSLQDKYYLPALDLADHNQISWQYDSGISVQYSIDGVNYTQVNNGSNIPGFSGGYLYYTITISKPSKLTGFKFVAYKDIKMPSSNSLLEIDAYGPYTLGRYSGVLIDHSDNMGIFVKSGNSLKVSDDGLTPIHSVEFLYNPSSISSATPLFECGNAKYSWNASGVVSKSNISNLYVNGKSLSGETDISNVFSSDIWHHVAIEFTALQTSVLYLNSNAAETQFGPDSLFAHIAIYSDDISGYAVNHYKYLTSKVSEASTSDTVTFPSESYKSFAVDKVVISTQ